MSQPHPPSEELFAYRDGELDAERRALIEAHILSCTRCAGRVEDLSDAEGALRDRNEEPDAAYFDRLSDAVMRRVTEGAPAAPRAKAPRAAEPAPARRGRRRSFEDEPRGHAPGLPWAAILSTVAAGAAVIVVGIFLAQRQDAWRDAPEPGLVGAPQGRAAGDTEAKQDASEPSAPDAPADEGLAAVAPEAESSEADRAALSPPASGGAIRTESAEEALPEVADRKAALQKGGVDAALSRERAASERPSAAAQAAPAPSAPSTGQTYAGVIARHGLPPLYDPAQVRSDALLRAEPDFRALYQYGGAGADSARARIYLAEAARLRAGEDLDAETYDAIVHHYQRALRLAKDPETWRVAKRRLDDFVSKSAPAR
ncbi:MAG TPA: zf-HC2 domain-containing protein [Acidobacteriota bacterium]|nr:zf-HC2 domain-containing protein [Acidobacteriota bacterium]